MPVRVYLESDWLVPSNMNVNYIGPIRHARLPGACGAGDISCLCDQRLGITTTRVYAAIPFEAMYQAQPPLVSNLVVASGRAYQWFDLASGQNIYIDRTYRFGSPIPASINGQFTLRTASDDKFSSANATHVSFTVNQASTVYVLYTRVSTTLESTWLTDANGWSLEDYTVPTGAEAARKVQRRRLQLVRQ